MQAEAVVYTELRLMLASSVSLNAASLVFCSYINTCRMSRTLSGFDITSRHKHKSRTFSTKELSP